MYKRITEVGEGPFEGYVYTNGFEDDVFVEVYDDGSGATILDSNQSVILLLADIPKMINALQMAYEHLKEKTS